ncbi:MAG: hypothetical protein ACOYT4_02885 [Nanoarchaeota archaeon]
MATIEKLEKNVQTSFGCVKKDLGILNDTVNEIQEKMQHLSLNHAVAISEIEKLRKELNDFKKGSKTKSKKK